MEDNLIIWNITPVGGTALLCHYYLGG